MLLVIWHSTRESSLHSASENVCHINIRKVCLNYKFCKMWYLTNSSIEIRETCYHLRLFWGCTETNHSTLHPMLISVPFSRVIGIWLSLFTKSKANISIEVTININEKCLPANISKMCWCIMAAVQNICQKWMTSFMKFMRILTPILHYTVSQRKLCNFKSKLHD